MTFARAGHGLVPRGGWRCFVRFCFVGGNFVRGSMSIFATMSMISTTSCPATADANANVTADCFQNIANFVSRARRRRWLLRRARREALRTNAFASLHIDPRLLGLVPGEILTGLWNACRRSDDGLVVTH